MKLVSSLLAFGLLAACGGGAAKPAATPEPEPRTELDLSTCGWRESSPSCTADADCAADAACVDGLGQQIIPPSEGGVTPMPPYERERIKFCEPRGCPVPETPPTDDGPPPVPEPT